MADLSDRIRALSPEQQALFEMRLHKRGSSPPKAQAITPIPSRNSIPLPLSFAQERLWILDQLESNTSAYNIPAALRLLGHLHVAALEQAFNAVVQRHESLRTTFAVLDDSPIQIIAPELRLPLPVINLQHLPEPERETTAIQRTIAELQAPFDLRSGPLIRATLLRLNDAEHILLLAMHHIISDGWSMDVLIREFCAFYQAALNGQPAPLPPLPIQYADFAFWQRQWLRGEILERQLDYWRRHLQDAPALLALPTDHPRPPMQTYRGATQPVEFSLELTEQVRALCRQEGATLFMLLLAAFQILLHRYSGQTDISVGSFVTNRTRREVEGLIGFFVNSLVFRVDLGGRPSFEQVLRQVREVALSAYAHQDVPFEQLLGVLQPKRSLSQTPLFQVMLVLQHSPVSKLEVEGLTFQHLNIGSGRSNFDMTLWMFEGLGALKGSFEYNTDLFEAATIERLAAHFVALLSQLVAAPQQPIDTLPLLTAAERQQILVTWNATAPGRLTECSHAPQACVHQLFEAQAAATPDAVALVFPSTGSGTRQGDEQRLTYRELNRRANQLAHYLLTLQVGPEVLVGLHVERSPWMVIGVLAVLKAGGAYLPLDPAYPAERIAFALGDSRPQVLLTTSDLAERLGAGSGVPLVLLDTDDLIAQAPETNPQVPIGPDNLMYIIYTSGSTGQPKGVMISHRAMVNYITAARDMFEIESEDRILQFASISFDTAAEEIYPFLSCGATLVLRTEALLSSAPTFLQACQELGLTVLDLPTAYWHQLTAEIAAQQLCLPESLRLVIIGGEQAVPDRVAMWQQSVGNHVRLINTYGPTEATVVTTAWELPGQSGVGAPLQNVPIGRPVYNTQVYVLDARLNPAPIGIPGELHIGGAGLARGYLGRPDLTAERFIPNPFAERGGEGERGRGGDSPSSSILHPPSSQLYRTGDLARWRADGQLEFLGRVDRQVKLRGFRIELGEIEAVLEQHPNVHAAVVLLREDTPGDQRLVAYFVPALEDGGWKIEDGRAGAPESPSSILHPPSSIIGELRAWVQSQLPEYMVPGAWVELETLPRTASGKLDRQALPAPSGERIAQGELVLPRTPLEEAVAEVWQEVLGVAQVSVHDSFFDQGGHSLLATQVIARIRENFGVEVPLRHLFQTPTVADLAFVIEEMITAEVAALADDEAELLASGSPEIAL